VTYTRQNTSLNAKQAGDPVNLEVDILAKYVEKFTGGSQSRMTVEFLAEHGFA